MTGTGVLPNKPAVTFLRTRHGTQPAVQVVEIEIDDVVVGGHAAKL